MKPAFGHSLKTQAFWRRLGRKTIAEGGSTPFYLFDPEWAASQIRELERFDFGRPVTHWLSCKTQPLPALLRWWRKQSRPIEVVSELELQLALDAGFDRVLINGPAKHRWLSRFPQIKPLVHFDSVEEIKALLPQAKRQRWETGLRICTQVERDSEIGSAPTQFGFLPDEAPAALRLLRHSGLEPIQVHFHLRTNVPKASDYAKALKEVLAVCRDCDWSPAIIDMGGGLPPPHTLSPGGLRYDAQMSLTEFAASIREAIAGAPAVQEIWMENGRFVLAGSGVLVVTVLDVKERAGIRQLICDGGRTMNALISTWEQHALLPLDRRGGPNTMTAVYGPTCMAFDRLAFCPLPRSLRPGDRLIWMDAGAYHLPWETRFSHELAEIWWHEEGKLERVRKPKFQTQGRGRRR